MPRLMSPFFHPAFAGRLEGLATPSKGPTLRVWLPSRRCQPLSPWKPLSAPHTPGLSSSEHRADFEALPEFPPAIRSCVFSADPTACHRRFSGLCARTQPYIQLPAAVKRPDGAAALVSFHASRAFPSPDLEELSFSPPLTLFVRQPPKKPPTGTPGDFSQRRGISLVSKGACPSGVFNRLLLPSL